MPHWFTERLQVKFQEILQWSLLLNSEENADVVDKTDLEKRKHCLKLLQLREENMQIFDQLTLKMLGINPENVPSPNDLKNLENAVKEIRRELENAPNVIPKKEHSADSINSVKVDDVLYGCQNCKSYFVLENMCNCPTGHMFCGQCIRSHIAQFLDSSQKPFIPCIDKLCSSSFSQASLLLHLDNDTVSRIDEFLLSTDSAKILENLIHCKYCKMPVIFDYSPEDSTPTHFTCPNLACSKSYCIQCNLDWTDHEGRHCILEKIEENCSIITNGPVENNASCMNGEESGPDSSAEPQKETFDCPICCEELEFSQLCSCLEGHLFCTQCLKNYAKESVYGHAKAEIRCMDESCDAIFSPSTLYQYVDNDIIKKLEERSLQENLNAAKIDNLVCCKFCTMAIVMDTPVVYNKVFVCPNSECLKEYCLICGAEWANHFGIPCKEIESTEETSSRTDLEERMAETVIRRCHKCQTALEKSEGCNKLVCRCGATMCYVCRQPDIVYTHFCNHVIEPGQKCTTCNACFLWENTALMDDKNLEQLKNECEAQQNASEVEKVAENQQPSTSSANLDQNETVENGGPSTIGPKNGAQNDVPPEEPEAEIDIEPHENINQENGDPQNDDDQAENNPENGGNEGEQAEAADVEQEVNDVIDILQMHLDNLREENQELVADIQQQVGLVQGNDEQMQELLQHIYQLFLD